MKGPRYVYWQDGQFWTGYLEDYPDYLTQGESLEDLQEHLRDLFAELSGGHIPAVLSRSQSATSATPRCAFGPTDYA